MIINSHAHVNTDGNYFFYNDYVLARFLEEMKQNGIDMAFPALNPKVGIFRCPNDCSMRCALVQGMNNLNNCGCNHPNRHRTEIIEKDGRLVIRCKTCGKTILRSVVDPLREYNLKLIHMTKAYRHKIKPLIYICLCSATIQSEIDFFEKNYPDDFVGFKLHPWNDQVNVANFRVHCSRPILIHTGIRELESAKNAIAFAEKNSDVKVVIAHAAALEEEVLKKIAKMHNVYVDCCPSVFMFRNKITSLFSPQKITTPKDIYYKVLNFVPSRRILFGTDSPWGNSQDELAVVRNLNIPESTRELILFKNAFKLYLK